MLPRVQSWNAVLSVVLLAMASILAAPLAGQELTLSAAPEKLSEIYARIAPSARCEDCGPRLPSLPNKAAGDTAFGGRATQASVDDPTLTDNEFLSFQLNDFPGQTVLALLALETDALRGGFDFDPLGATLWAVTGEGLGTVSLSSGLFTLELEEAVPWAGLAIDPVTGDFWGQLASATETFIVYLDPDTDSAIPALTVNVPSVDIAINCEGDLYLVDTTGDELVRVSFTDLSADVVGSLGIDVGQFSAGLDFDNDTGELYASPVRASQSDSDWGIIDLGTGAFDILASNDPLGSYDFAIRNTCDWSELEIAMDDSPDPAGTSGVTYTVTVTNNGVVAAQNVAVSHSFPSGLSFGSTSDCDNSPSSSTCRLGTIDPGETKVYTLEADVATGTSGDRTLTATVTTSTNDRPHNNTAEATTTIDAVAPELDILHPVTSSSLALVGDVVTLRGQAADPGGKVTRVSWSNEVLGREHSSGVATGTDVGDSISWLIRDLGLSTGRDNVITVTTEDDRGNSATRQLTIESLESTDLLETLEFNGSQVDPMSTPELGGTGRIDVTVPSGLELVAGDDAIQLLLNGMRLSGNRVGHTLTVFLVLDNLPSAASPPGPDRGTIEDGTYALDVVVELVDGTAARLEAPFPILVDSGTPPATTEVDFNWFAYPGLPVASGAVRDVAVGDGLWVLTGDTVGDDAFEDDGVEWHGGHPRHFTRLVSHVTNSRLHHWDGSSWTTFEPADLGDPAYLFTSVEQSPGGTLFIGTDKGLLEAAPNGTSPPTVEEVEDFEGLDVGPWISSLSYDRDRGRLWIGHRGSRFYKLSPFANKRYWVDYGGVSRYDIILGLTDHYRAHQNDDGSWEGVAGTHITAVGGYRSREMWAGSAENGLSRLVDGEWTYQNTTTTEIPFDEISGLWAVSADEVWAAGADRGAAALSLADAGSSEPIWSHFTAASTPLPSDQVRAVAVDDQGVAWFATAAGVASLVPGERRWDVHGGSSAPGNGDAGALAVLPPVFVANRESDGDMNLFKVDVDDRIDLLAPDDRERVLTSSDGLATVTLEWEDLLGVASYEVFLNGRNIGRRAATANSRSIAVRDGDYRWQVRPIYSDDTAGALTPARSFSVFDDRGPFELATAFKTSGGETRMLVAFQANGDPWNSFVVEPGFASVSGALDLAAGADGRLATADDTSKVEQYPRLLAPSVPISVGTRAKLDGTAEDDGLVVGRGGHDDFALYNGTQAWLAGDASLSIGNDIDDVAGLSGGRVAFLSDGNRVEVWERLEDFAPLMEVPELSVTLSSAADRIAGFRDGGFAVLRSSAEMIDVYDASSSFVHSLDASSALGSSAQAVDIAIDEHDRLFLLSHPSSGPGTVHYTLGVDDPPTWTEALFALPAVYGDGIDAGAMTSIATFMRPTGREPTPPRPYLPMVPDPPGTPLEVGGLDLWSTGGWDTSGSTTCANDGTVRIFYFLSLVVGSGDSLCFDNTTTNPLLEGDGQLFLHYDSLAGFPPAGVGASGFELADGDFTIDSGSGEIDGAIGLDVPPLGSIDIDRLNILGMGGTPASGGWEESTSRSGIAVVGRTSGDFGVDRLRFENLFLADFGEAFHATFGEPGLPGLAPPFDQGDLSFGTSWPLRLRTRGGIDAASSHLDFPTTIVSIVEAGGGAIADREPLFDLRLSNLEIRSSSVSFEDSAMLFAQRFPMLVDGGELMDGSEGEGIYAPGATLLLGRADFTAEGFFAGHASSNGTSFAGLLFDSADDFPLGGRDVDLEDIRLEVENGLIVEDRLLAARGEIDFAAPSHNLEASLDDIVLPLDFFDNDLGQGSDPEVAGGEVTVGDPSDPQFRLSLGPAMIIASDSFMLPPVVLESSALNESIGFGGGRIEDTGILLENPGDPLMLFGTAFEVDSARLDNGGFSTAQLSGLGDPQNLNLIPGQGLGTHVLLHELGIDLDGDISAAGGTLTRFGFPFAHGGGEVTGDSLSFGTKNLKFGNNFSIGSFSTELDFSNGIGLEGLNVAGISGTSKKYGSLRVLSFDIFTFPNPLPSWAKDLDGNFLWPTDDLNGDGKPDNDPMVFGGELGLGKWKFNVGGHIVFNHGSLALLRGGISFPYPGVLLYTPPNIYLNSVDGILDLERELIRVDAVVTGGPKIKVPPFIPITVFSVWSSGSAQFSWGTNAFRAQAQLRLFRIEQDNGPPPFAGYQVARATFLAGRVIDQGQVLGDGFRLWGEVDLLGDPLADDEQDGILHGEVLVWLYLGDSWGGQLSGRVSAPSSWPVLSGHEFASVEVGIKGTLGNDEIEDAILFEAQVGLNFCAPPNLALPVCSTEFLTTPSLPGTFSAPGEKSVLGVLDDVLDVAAPIPGSFIDLENADEVVECLADPCIDIEVGFKFGTNTGIELDPSPSEILDLFRLGKAGYLSPDGVITFHDYKRLGSKSLATHGEIGDKGTRVLRFVVPPGSVIQKMGVRMDYTDFSGNAELELTIPGGQTFSRANTPEMIPERELQIMPGEIAAVYSDVQHVADPTVEWDVDLKEFTFLLEGALEHREVELPDGETIEFFAPGLLSPGTYEVRVISDGDADQADVEFLVGNLAPRFVDFELEEVGEHQYRVAWDVEDPDGDSVLVRVQLAPELTQPNAGLTLGPQEGFLDGETNELTFDMADLLDHGFNQTLQVILTLDDGASMPIYGRIGSVEPMLDDKTPPQVQGVVAFPNDRTLEVYWDPVDWTPPDPNVRLASYVIVVTDTAPGIDGLEEIITVGQIEGEAPLTEALIKVLVPGHTYRVRMLSASEEVIAGAGGPGPNGEPTDEIIQRLSPPSPPITVQLVSTSSNNAPTFLSVPFTRARLGEPYVSPVRAEDLDGDPLTLTLAEVDPPLPGLQVGSTGAGSWELTYDPQEEHIGRHFVQLAVDDGTDEALQEFYLEVTTRGSATFEASIVSTPIKRVFVGEAWTYPVEVRVPDGVDTLLSLVRGPEDMSLDPLTGIASWLPDEGDVGLHPVFITLRREFPGCSSCGQVLARHSFVIEVFDNPFADLFPVLLVTPTAQPIAEEGGELFFEVANAGVGSVDWTATVTQGQPWMAIASGGSGTDSGTIRLVVGANPTPTARVGKLLVVSTTAEGVINSPREVTVVQQRSRVAVLEVSPTGPVEVGKEGGRQALTVANAGAGPMVWEADVEQGFDWLRIGGGFGTEGSGPGTFDIDFLPNSGPERSGVLRFESDDASNGFVEVLFVQEGGLADLSILKTVYPEIVLPEQQLIYTVTVINDGPDEATDVVVSDTLPPELVLVETLGCLEDPVGVPECTLGTIPAGGEAEFQVVTEALELFGPVVNTVTVDASTPDPNPGNNTDSAEATIGTILDIPTLSSLSMALLSVLLLACAVVLMRRRQG